MVYARQTVRVDFYSNNQQEIVQGIIIGVTDHLARPLVQSSNEYLSGIFGNYGFAKQDNRWYAYLGLIPTEPTMDRLAERGFFKQRYQDLYRVDLQTGRVQHITGGTPRSRSWVVDARGQIVAVSEYDSDSGAWKVFAPDTPGHILAAGKSPFDFSLAGLARTPRTVLVREGGVDADTVELQLDTGRIETFLPPGKAIQLIHSRASHQLLGAVLVDDSDTLMFDSTLERRYKAVAKAFHGDVMQLVSASDDLNRMIVYVTGADTAGTWHLVDFSTGRSTPVGDEYPDVPDSMLGKVQMVDYAASDGLKLQGVLTLPPGRAAHDLPLVVIPHGPDGRARAHFEWMAEAFASRGYAVFQPNFRGSSGYGRDFRHAGFGQWGRKMQTDISDGVAALAARGIADAHRACIVGSTFGGYAALAGVTLQHGLYLCAASYGGLSDMHDFLAAKKLKDRDSSEHYADATMRYWDTYIGASSPDDPVLDTISPRELAKNADAPILLIYSQNDTVVPPQQSRDMASALKRAGKAVEILEIDKEDHALVRSATRIQALKAMVGFVEKYNPPEPVAR